jgi:hypothetical protein
MRSAELQTVRKHSYPAVRGYNAHPKPVAAVKAGLSHARKWAFGEGTGLFALRVPRVPETKELISYLRKHKEPAAEYIDAQAKGRDALQWHLSTWEWRTLYRLCPDA